MAGERTGPSTPTIVLIAVLATPVVLILIFWLIGSGGGDTAAAKAELPNLVGKGLEWAKDKADASGFDDVETHDALGRDRRWSDDKDWVVCFQTPGAGSQDPEKPVELGAVQIDEKCPSSDQALYKKATTEMPDLKNRTAYMASEILGDNASVRFIDREDGDEVDGNLGDYRVCSQEPKAGETFDGVPVSMLVVEYEERC
ncbi:hypothetical protein LWF15_34390 [Kineosporia rhizophila]|uniref:hypothetical protein n=1 Tax=Kineosporia TaxID=49184 RepID=UPI001E4984CF|nr:MULTISPECIES: hypothetical protein [Kineosporia]MCE0540598.1 hypothetical protein [Kineosporia rhizophila]GLY14096.1 hypothetical protein Kisp01_11120 [Kineosporia sp. NBRC 101677]